MTLEIGANSSVSALRRTVFETPAIDNHAHPLLKEAHRNAMPFEGLISEASGDALSNDAMHTIACLRATKELASLYGLSDNASWEDVKQYRIKRPYLELCEMNFRASKISCLLLDDGLGGVAELAEDYGWHGWLTNRNVKRIARVETIAEVRL